MQTKCSNLYVLLDICYWSLHIFLVLVVHQSSIRILYILEVHQLFPQVLPNHLLHVRLQI